ncbi:hypothetical protein [Paenibacillus sp. PL91]|uniref:hypothetical protein n=1 Tax=Paenibacillus sp. PL91 TaxID=2729538 RepID=UPI00145F7FB8|nr:hypothetical protein [Paenibacillus sp. PL91]MBC9203802.1 hypothetical protein [Paenibacillus sp. PL91]
MKKTNESRSIAKLILIAMMSVTVVFTASACNNDADVNNNGNNNAITDGVNDTPDATADPAATDEVTTP